MATPNDVLNIARGEIGYSRWDDPKPGTKYGRWYADLTGDSYYGVSGVPYCAMFVSWVFAHANQSAPGLPGAYCPWIVNAGRKAGATVSTKKAQAGDIVLFDWGGDGVSDHVGIVESNNGSYLTTIEGNTSGGNNSNGGAVMRRTRAYSTVICIIRPTYGEASKGDEDMPLTNEDVAKIWAAAPPIGQIWEYVYPGDGNQSNQYNRIAEILSNVSQIKSQIAELQNEFDLSVPIENLNGELYRLKNDTTGEHMFTSSYDTATIFSRGGWTLEGKAFSLPSGIALYGLLNPMNGDYMLTVDEDEAQRLYDGGWQSQGIVGIAASSGTEVHRLYNDANKMHMFSSSNDEINGLTANGWADEGVAFYAL